MITIDIITITTIILILILILTLIPIPLILILYPLSFIIFPVFKVHGICTKKVPYYYHRHCHYHSISPHPSLNLAGKQSIALRPIPVSDIGPRPEQLPKPFSGLSWGVWKGSVSFELAGRIHGISSSYGLSSQNRV